jgi:diacylglycerol kinase (ATP)
MTVSGPSLGRAGLGDGSATLGSTFDTGRLVRAAGYSLAGLRDGVLRHTAFRLELFLGGMLTPIAIWRGDGGLERAVLLGSLMLVLIVELLNSAVETVVDRIGPERDELSRQAKDLGSAAVLLSLLSVPVLWGLVLYG